MAKNLDTVSVKADFPHLRCTMSDGSVYDLDLTETLLLPGPAIAPLRDPGFFNQAYIGEDSQVCWPNGWDLAPDKPARRGKRISP